DYIYETECIRPRCLLPDDRDNGIRDLSDSEGRHMSTMDDLSRREYSLNLFLVGFLVLFLELTCIRWFAAYVIFLQFFTNVVLIASFLGMSCGCLAAGRRRNWLEFFPALAVAAVLAALATYAAYHFWSGFVIDVGGQQSPQEV